MVRRHLKIVKAGLTAAFFLLLFWVVGGQNLITLAEDITPSGNEAVTENPVSAGQAVSGEVKSDPAPAQDVVLPEAAGLPAAVAGATTENPEPDAQPKDQGTTPAEATPTKTTPETDTVPPAEDAGSEQPPAPTVPEKTSDAVPETTPAVNVPSDDASSPKISDSPAQQPATEKSLEAPASEPDAPGNGAQKSKEAPLLNLSKNEDQEVIILPSAIDDNPATGAGEWENFGAAFNHDLADNATPGDFNENNSAYLKIGAGDSGKLKTITFTKFGLSGSQVITNLQLRASLAVLAPVNNSGAQIQVEMNPGTGNSDSWISLGEIPADKEISNAANGGFFLFSMPLPESLSDLEKAKIRFSYQSRENEQVAIYLDSVWLEAVCQAFIGPKLTDILLKYPVVDEKIPVENLIPKNPLPVPLAGELRFFPTALDNEPVNKSLGWQNSEAAFKRDLSEISATSDFNQDNSATLQFDKDGTAGQSKAVTFTVFDGIRDVADKTITNLQLRASLAAMAGKNEGGNGQIEVDYLSGKEGASWISLGSIPVGEGISNAANGGFFLFSLPLPENSGDLAAAKARFSFKPQIGAQGTVYLDALWLEATYEPLPTKEEVIDEKRQKILDRFFKNNENPTFVFASLEDKKNFFQKIFSWAKGEKKEVTAKLINPREEETGNGITIDGQTVKIDNLDARQFRPGRYKIKISVKEGDQATEEEQEFEWGVLTVNSDKSIYKIGDTAQIALGVLNKYGHTVCDAQVVLSITDPGGNTTYPEVAFSDDCEIGNITNKPDYTASFATAAAGTYKIDVIATTPESTQEITDSFEVKDSVDFDVSRTGPTRINPTAEYQMRLRVVANKDYAGKIIDYVPVDFEINAPSGNDNASTTVEIDGNLKKISWDADLKTGQVYNFGYTFKAPEISPYIFLLGPLRIGDFSELRQWQIASDAVYYSVSSTNWDADGVTWSLSSGGSSTSAHPIAGDTAIVELGHAVVVNANAACATLTFGSGTSANNTVTINASLYTLAVSGTITIPKANTGYSNTMAVATGILTAGTLAFTNGGAAGTTQQVTISTGHATITGDVTQSGSTGSASIIFSSTGTLTLGGALFTLSTGTMTQVAASTVEYHGTVNQTIQTFSYRNLTISNSGGAVAALATATPIVNGALTVNAGSILDVSYALGGTTKPTSLALYCGATTGSDITGSGSIALGGNVTVTSAGTGTDGAVVVPSIALGSTRTFTVADDGSAANTDLTLSGAVSGSGLGITKAGAGQMYLSANNTYTGAVTISAGTIIANTLANSGSNSSLGTGGGTPEISMAAGTTLRYVGSGHSSSRAITLTGTGVTLDAEGSGTMTLSGAVSGSTYALVLDGAGNGAEGGVIGTSTGTVTKNGGGTWTVSGNSTYTGLTTINVGTLKLGGVGSGSYSPLGTTGSGTVVAATSAALDLGGYQLVTAEALTLNGTGVSNGGALMNSGAGTTYSGLITLGSTGVSICGGSGTINISNASTIAGSGFALTLCGAAGGTLGSILGTGAGTLTVNASNGTWILSNSNTYTGLTTISAGTLKLGGDTPLGTTGAGTVVSVTGAALDLGGFTLGTSEALTLNGTGVSAGGALMNSGGAATYTGLITLGSSGVNICGGSGTINISNASTIAGSGFALTLCGAAGGTLGSILGTGAGTLTVSNGTWIVSNSNTYTGLTTISAGTLKLGATGGATYTPLGTVGGGVQVSATGAALDLGGFLLGTSEALTLNGTGVSAGGALMNSGGNTTYNGAVTLGSASVIGTTGNIILGGGMTGGGYGLTKVGAGSLSLGSGTVALGALTVGAGTLVSTSGTMTVTGDFANNSTFTHNSGTVNFSGTAQNISGSGSLAFNNLTLSNSGTKTFSKLFSVVANLTLNGAQASLATGTTSTSNQLYFVAALQPPGTFGSTSSAATYKNDTYFAATNGIVSVAAGGCVPGTWQGSTSAWATPTNWCNNTLPDASTDVIIPSAGTQPIISAAGSLCRNITINSGASLTISGTYGLTVSGNWVNNGGTFTANSSTVTFNGVSKTIGGSSSTTFYNVSTSGSATITTAYATTIGGALSIADGTTFTAAGFDLTVTGTTTVGGGSTGSLVISNATGAKTFTGDVTIAAGATWNNSANEIVSFGGSLAVNSAASNITWGTAAQTFTGASKSITTTQTSQTYIIPYLSVTGTLTNSLASTNELTVSTTLDGNGGLTQGANANLNIGGTSGITTLTASASGNTVDYTAAAQTVHSNTYYNLTLSGSGTDVLQSGTTAVGGDLILSGTVATATAANLTISGALGINNGTTFTAAGYDLTVTGTTVVGGGSTGSLVINSATGTKTFGNVTISAGATWNNSANEIVSFGGSLAVNSAASNITWGTAAQTFTGASKSITTSLTSQTYIIPYLSVTGSLTNSLASTNTLTVSTTLDGNGGLTQDTNANLNIGGTSGITTLTASASGNTVNYTAAAQTVHSNTYYNLTLSGSGTDVLQTGTTAIGGNLTLSGTVATATVVGLTVTGNVSLGNGTTFTAAGFDLTVTGTTTVGGGSTGSLVISSATGAKTFTGNVTIAAGATWNNSGNEIVSFGGSLAVNSAASNITWGTAAQTFTGASKSITTNLTSQTYIIPYLSVTGTLTNSLASTNTLTVSTTLDGGGTLTQDTNANLNIGGTLGITTLTASASGNTVNYTAAAQTVHSNTYYNLTLSGSGTDVLQTGTTAIGGNLTLSGTVATATVVGLTVTGNLSLGNGTTFTAAGFDLTVTGTTTVGGGSTGSLVINNVSGTKIFTGLVTVAAGATWNNSGNSAITFRGGITTSGAFTAGSGVQTFDTNAQNLTCTAASLSLPNMTVTTITVTDKCTGIYPLTVSTALSGTGGLTQDTNANLYIGGTSGITTLTASASGNTVNYSGTAQNVHNNSYQNLTLSGSGNKTFAGATTIAGTLAITDTALANFATGANSTANALTLGGVSEPSGTWGSTLAAKTYINDTYFASSTGYVTVATGCTAGNWLGTTSTDWNIASNWCGAIPGATTDVTIPSGGNQPSIGAANGLARNLTINSGATLTILSTNGLTVSGNWANNGGTLTANSSTVTFNGVSKTIGGSGSTTFYNVSTGGSATITTAYATTIGGALTIADGTTFTAAGYDLTVTGTTTVGGGSTGSLVISSATGTKTFTGDVTIAAGATWNNSGNEIVSFGGSLAVNSAASNITWGTAAQTFTGSTKSITTTQTSQTYIIPYLSVTGSLTNSLASTNKLTVSTTLDGAGALTQDTNANLNIGGTSGITGLTASASGNTVNYTGTAQNVHNNSYQNLTLSGSGNKTFAGATTIAAGLAITDTALANFATGANSTANALTLGGASEPSGTWGSTLAAKTYINDTYFASSTGYVTVATGCTAGNWLGTTSTDWNIASNWCGGIPGATTDITIPSGGNQPSIGAAGGLARDITINSGATLTILSTNGLTVSGNWTNNGGTFTGNSSTVTLNKAGGTTQAISGDTSFYNLTATATAARTLQFAASSVTTVTHLWTVTGASNQLITLTSSTTSQWSVNPTSASISYVDLNYSNNTSGSLICATYSQSTYNNNTNWATGAGSSCNAVPTFNTGFEPHEDPVSYTTTPTDVGDYVTFKAKATDTDGNQWYLAICKSDAITTNSNAEPTCTGGDWEISSATDSDTVATAAYQITAGETSESYDWYAFACDKVATSPGCSPMSNSGTATNNGTPFSVNHAPGFTASSNAGNKNPGAQQTVTVSSGQYSDGDSAGSQDQVKLYVCPTQAFTDGASPHCNVTELCSSSLTTPGSPMTCNFNLANPLAHGTKHYYPYVADSHGLASGGAGQGEDKTYSANDVAPIVSGTPTFNGLSSTIDLTNEGGTTDIVVTGVASDDNLCDDLDAANTFANAWLTSYTGAACVTNAGADANKCYFHATCTQTGSDSCAHDGVDKTAGFSCTIHFQYYANPTDTDSPWDGDSWTATFIPGDGTGPSATTGNSGAKTLDSFLAMSLETGYDAISYPNLNVGDTTDPLLEKTHVVASGNVSLDATVSGTDLTKSGASIGVGYQKYGLGTSAPAWSAGTVLSASDAAVDLNCCKSGYTQTPASARIWWGINIPSGKPSGSYSGSNTITAVENAWSNSGDWCE